MSIYTWNGDAPGWSDRISYSLNLSVECYNAMSKYLKVEYPLPKLGGNYILKKCYFSDHLALPFFSYGGMENWGLIIYEPGVVLFHEKVGVFLKK